MEDIFSSLLKAFGIALKTILQLTLLETVCYYLGFVVLKVVSLGRLPEKSNRKSKRLHISYVGLFSILFSLLIVAVVNGVQS